jgi:hypothetical protein
VHTCIFMHSWRGAFTRIVVHVDSGAFLYSCILMHSHVSHLQMHFVSTARPKPIRSMLHASYLPCEFSLESARLLLCMFVWSTSLAHLCAFSRMLRYFYAFSRIMKQSWSKYHAISSRHAWRIQIRQCSSFVNWNTNLCRWMHHSKNASECNALTCMRMRWYASHTECIHTVMHMNVSRAPNAR